MKIAIEHSTTPDGHRSQEVVAEKERTAPSKTDVKGVLGLVPAGQFIQRIDIETDYGGDDE